MFLWLIIQLLMTIKPAHKILSLTHRNCWGKPNIWILPPLLQKNKYGRSQLYRDQIFSHTIYLYNRKFDWCLIIDPIWLVWHTSLTDPLTDPLTEPPITYPTRQLRGIFLQKNNSINWWHTWGYLIWFDQIMGPHSGDFDQNFFWKVKCPTSARGPPPRA